MAATLVISGSGMSGSHGTIAITGSFLITGSGGITTIDDRGTSTISGSEGETTGSGGTTSHSGSDGYAKHHSSGSTYEDPSSTSYHSPSGSHYSGSTPVSGTAGSTTVTDGTVEITGSLIVSGASPAITIMAGELIVSGSSYLGTTVDHVATVSGHLTAAYGMASPTHKISGTMGTFATLSGSAATLHKLTLGNVAVTSTGAELNLVDGSQAGTILINKAVIYSSAGVVTASSFTGFATRTIHGEFTGAVSGSMIKSSMVSASLLVTGGIHKGYSFTGYEAGLDGAVSASMHLGTTVSASTLVTGGMHHGHSFSGSHGNFAIMSASTINTHAFAPTTVSASSVDGFRHDGYEFSGSSGFFAIMSASTFTTHVFAPTTVSSSIGEFATLSGSAATLHKLTLGNTAVTSDAQEINLLDGAAAETIVNSKAVIYGNIGEVSASTFKGFSVQAADGLFTAPVSASLHTGFRHDGYEFSGSSGFFAIMSASTFSTHVFAPTTVSASSGQFATLSGSATTVHTLNGLTLAEIGLLDGAAAETIVNSKAVIYGNIGEVSGSTFKGFSAQVTSVEGTSGVFTGVVTASSYTGFATRTLHGEFTGIASASLIQGFAHIGQEASYDGFVSASTLVTGGMHHGHSFSGSHGNFAIMSASTLNVHVFAPTSISASSGQFATLSGSACTFDNIALGNVAVTSTGTELNLVDGSQAGTILNSKAVIYSSVGVVTASSFTGFAARTIHGEFTGIASASLIQGFAHIGQEAAYDGFVSASAFVTGGHVYAYGITGSFGTFDSAVSASAFEGFRFDGVQGTFTRTAATPPTVADAQIRLNYDADNYAFIGVDQNGSMTIETVDNGGATKGDIVLNPDGNVSRFQNGVQTLDNGGVNGEIVFFGTEDGADTLAAGKLMYLATGGIWKHADADAAASAGGVLLGLALGTDVAAGILLQGYMNISGTLTSQPVYKLTHGAAQYAHTVPGEIAQTAPTGSGDVVRIVGHAVSSSSGKIIYFNPSADWIELI